jgi:beta-N-acetylhexosaminidase
MSRKIAATLAVLALGVGGCGTGKEDKAAPPTVISQTAGGKNAERDGNAPLTLRQAIGQHLVFAYAGGEPPPALKRRIARGEAAGVVLFSRNVRSVAAVRSTIARLQRIPRPAAVDAPLLVLVDQEGGDVRRLPGPPVTPAADTTSAEAARANGRAAGRLLRRAGINVDLAPVVDVARAGGSGSVLERERRTYGRDPAIVVARAGAFAAGLRDGGVEPVLKHFPGFGAATINTDDGAARVDLSLATLRAVDGMPYRRLKARAVMLSTAIYPRVDPRPAAFSRRWVEAELRGRLGFDGITVTDDLQAAAVARFGSPSQLALFALQAGVDLPLFAQDYATADRVAAGLERAVRSGALSRARLDAGARRVLRWRMTLGAGH